MAAPKTDEYNFMPICINLRDRQVLMVGGGRVALRKTRLLLPYTSRILVVAPQLLAEFKTPEFQSLTIIEDSFDVKYLAGVWLMYICTADHELNHQIKGLAEQHHILASVCDDPAWCDFVSPAVLQHEGMTVAVSSNGRSATRSVALRDRIRKLTDQLFPL